MMACGAHVAGTIDALRAIIGDRITTADAARLAHGKGEGVHALMPPDAVAFPETNDEVTAIVRTCAANKVPLIPFGAGTSLEGQVQAVRGGISVDLTRMDKILRVSAADLDCTVQAGVTREALNAFIRSEGLFFPLDPGANATLGGMAATRASGTNAVRYGTMRDMVLGLTVITAAGNIIRTGGRARKSSAGYDLTRLFIGSEGTLGVITELHLRVFGIPEQIASGLCQFESLRGAVEAVTMVLQMGIPIARIELLDHVQMAASIAYSKLEGLEAKPTLFVEFHGSELVVEHDAALVTQIFAEQGGGGLKWSVAQEDRTALWKARHNAYWAGRSLAPGRESIATDACVPLSALVDTIMETSREAEELGLLCPIVGHVGDGNFHALILYDANSPSEAKRAEDFAVNIARRALAKGGTCTGEHGIGLHRRGLLVEEHGAGVDLMAMIKHALDPHGIMNPGKLI